MKIGIYGYGNLGRALEIVALDFKVDVSCVFTRRDPDKVRTLRAPVYDRAEAEKFIGEIDCMMLCGSSLGDIKRDALDIGARFNTVDAFDLHSDIENYKNNLNDISIATSHTSVIAVGWDPGILSVVRAYLTAIMPRGEVNTFWGRGVSQGHSEVVRRIKGVRRAVEYTVPRIDAITLARTGKTLGKFERHRRECYVVADSDNYERIENEIRAIPEYYEGYETSVHFISEDEFVKEHLSMPHRGECIAFNTSGVYREHISRAEFNLTMDSNPELTASVMLAYAKACDSLSREGRHGAFDVFDIPPRYLLPKDKLSSLM
jgi:diaminopimelate dehydrogenase